MAAAVVRVEKEGQRQQTPRDERRREARDAAVLVAHQLDEVRHRADVAHGALRLGQARVREPVRGGG